MKLRCSVNLRLKTGIDPNRHVQHYFKGVEFQNMRIMSIMSYKAKLIQFMNL